MVLLVFVLTYAVLADLPGLRGLGITRTAAATAGAVAMVALGAVTPAGAVGEAISWDTLLLLLGMSIVSAAMAEAGLFRAASWLALRRARSRQGLLVAVVLLAGVLSALVVNDTVCLMCTPLVLALVERAGLPPLPYLLALAFGANAGSVATLTGNPQNMLIGALSGIGYRPFAAALVAPAVVSLLAVAAVLLRAFRAELAGPLAARDEPAPVLDRRRAALCGAVLTLTVAAFASGAPLAWAAMTGGAVLLVAGSRETLRRVDGGLLLFFAGLFVVVHAVGRAGIAERLYGLIGPLLGTGPVRQLFVFGGFTLAACQLVSNVPFVLLARDWVPHLAEPRLGWLSLALVSTLAGNLTPVASVANLIVLESAGDAGRIPFLRFLRLGAAATFLPLALGLGVLLLEHHLRLT